MEKEIVHVYITKWALTKGIIEADLEKKNTPLPYAGKYFYVYGKISGRYCCEIFSGDDFHLTHEDAEKRRDEMVKNKISSLCKQLKKYKKISPDIVESVIKDI